MTALSAGWAAPPGVKVFTTLRSGGVSSAPYDSLNLGGHVGDDPDRVRQNRALVRESRGWTIEPRWLNQVHGTTVLKQSLTGASNPAGDADGAVTASVGVPLVIMTADCLPVVACDRAGTVVGAFHAGWKGLLAGVLEEGLSAMDRSAADLMVWIGPAIGPDSYQVGPEVREAFLASDPAHAGEFAADGPGRWKFDLAGAAVRRLNRWGVTDVTRTPWDTYRDADLFFSHRRQSLGTGGPCGRMGTFICLEETKRSRSLS